MVRVSCQNGDGGGSWVGHETEDPFATPDVGGGGETRLRNEGVAIQEDHQIVAILCRLRPRIESVGTCYPETRKIQSSSKVTKK